MRRSSTVRVALFLVAAFAIAILPGTSPAATETCSFSPAGSPEDVCVTPLADVWIDCTTPGLNAGTCTGHARVGASGRTSGNGVGFVRWQAVVRCLQGCVEPPMMISGECFWTISEGGCSDYQEITFQTLPKRSKACQFGKGARRYRIDATTEATAMNNSPIGGVAPPASGSDQDQASRRLCPGGKLYT